MNTEVDCAILIVEDDASVAEALSESLRMSGYRCQVAPTAQSAFDALSAANDFDVVLLDLQLDDERSEDLVDRLQRAEVTLPPLIIVSGRPNAEMRVAGRAIQAAAWLKKPLSFANVVAAIDIALDPASPARSA